MEPFKDSLVLVNELRTVIQQRDAEIEMLKELLIEKEQND